MSQITKNVTEGNKTNRIGLLTSTVGAGIILTELLGKALYDFFPDSQFVSYILDNSTIIGTVIVASGLSFIFGGRK